MDHIICERVLHENRSVRSYTFHEVSFLDTSSCGNTLLHDAATMLMTSNLHVLLNHSVVNELSLRRISPHLEDFLKHMITVDVVS